MQFKQDRISWADFKHNDEHFTNVCSPLLHIPYSVYILVSFNCQPGNESHGTYKSLVLPKESVNKRPFETSDNNKEKKKKKTRTQHKTKNLLSWWYSLNKGISWCWYN